MEKRLSIHIMLCHLFHCVADHTLHSYILLDHFDKLSFTQHGYRKDICIKGTLANMEGECA